MTRDPFRLFRAPWSSRPDAEPSPLDPQHLKPGRYDRAAADAMADAVHPLPDAPVSPVADLRHQLGAKDRLIERLEHDLEGVRADRDRLEAVVDGLRARLTAKRELLADLRAQLRAGGPTAAEVSGIPDDLLVPWAQRTAADDTAGP